ncbi:MAG TPA: divalent metal cation transporter, partial [Candidatus Angelobacter sp.]|nr:divalent metal cation transporter [Candidatus Angelobacter sp.]
MKKLLGITLGIMTALGGFVDLGQIVFTTQAGALFGYSLLWTIVLGTAAIIVYMEMCGRVAVVAREPVFSVVRARLGYRLGLFTLVASNLLNLITCAAELGGIAIVLHLLTGWPEKLLLAGSAFALAAIVLLLRFQWIERTFGLSGLLMIVFAVSAIALHPDWSRLAHGLLPHANAVARPALYWYFAVGIFSAMLMEYEVHFYSSGAIEEDWTPRDLGENFMVASFGSILGSLLTVGLLMLGALIFLPRHIFPDLLSTAVFAGAFPFAQKALVFSLLGTLACIAGAAVETALSGAYNVCQFFNLDWGKSRPVKEVPVYTAAWLAMFGLALLIALTRLR